MCSVSKVNRYEIEPHLRIGVLIEHIEVENRKIALFARMGLAALKGSKGKFIEKIARKSIQLDKLPLQFDTLA